jgi:hypothetical protein
VAGEEREAQREVGGGEDGEGLDEDVGDGLVTREVRVELVAGGLLSARGRTFHVDDCGRGCCFQIELIIKTSAGGGIQSPVPRVIGNVVVVPHHANMRK